MKPNCKCHDEPMYWNRDTRKRAGGFWRCAVKSRENSRKRHAANPSYVTEWQRAQGAEWRRAVDARWRAKHPEVKHEKDRRRRAQRARVPTDGHTRQQVWERDQGICQICGTQLDPKNWHEDHIVPLVLKGPDTMDNVQAACPPCNGRKDATTRATAVFAQ